MTDIKCRDCGAPNGVSAAAINNKMAATIAAMVRCDACAALVELQQAEQLSSRVLLTRNRRLRALPPELRGVDHRQTPLPEFAVQAARDWLANGRGLMLVGPVGTGKTYLAAAVAAYLMRQQNVSWQSVPLMLANAATSFGDHERAKAVSAITGHGALVLDDLDKIKPGEWAIAQLFTAIDNRVNHGAPLVVTTNKTPGQLANFFGGDMGDAIASRLAGYCVVVECAGHDARLRGAA